MPTILVTGAGGQLGSELKALAAQYPDWKFICPSRQELDISKQAEVEAFFKTHQPHYCLNTAAYTAVDQAESDQDQAYLVNKTAAIFLARYCQQYSCQLVHFSTDYVYKSEIGRPLVETDKTAPKGVYAASKLAGDIAVLNLAPAAMVIRTSWVYSTYGHNFVKSMLRLGRERDALGIVFDQIGTPTYAHDLAQAILSIIEKVENKTVAKEQLVGIFHYSNEGVCSWYDFALSIFELSNITCNVTPIESKAYPTPATRPHFSVLNKSKIKNTFDIQIPHWRESLKICLQRLEE